MDLPDDAVAVDVVLFRAAQDGRAIPIGGAEPVDLTAPDPPDHEMLTVLLDASVRLVASADLPADVVRAVASVSVPPRFQHSPWLYEHRALLFAEGECTLGGHVLRYHDQLGIHVEELALQPQEGGRTSFDLLTQPWIPVVRLDGEARVMGLKDVILDAHNIRRVAAEAPTMTASLHRLLLAVFHRAYGPPSEAAWGQLWAAERFPADPLRSYLDPHRHRFDLFHPRLPFMQCAELASLSRATAAKLVPYRAVGNNVTLFDHTTSADRVVLSPEEAARWLVTLHAFDPGGMKTPYEKDKSSERAPCNWFGVVLVEGRSLKESLLLNAPVYRPDYEKPAMTTPEDRPVWEEREGPSPRPDKRTARGWTDLLTWPSRRVLLSANGSGGSTMVDGVVITPGTRLDARLPDEEMMAAFRRPRDAKGRFKRDAPMLPVQLHPLRGIWRHSVELLLTDVWEEGRNRQRPTTLDQIAELAERRYIPSDAVYSLRVFGQRLDSKATVVETWLEEEVPAPVPLLRARDESLGALIGCAITLADEAGSALRALQSGYHREFRDVPVSDIDSGYWPRLSRPFGTFLVDLGNARMAGRSEAPATRSWGRQVTELATSAADRWVAGSPAEGRAMAALGKCYGLFQTRLRTAESRFQAQTNIYSAGTEDADA
ncbi:type I-E CRISPR-associated protein Cse1/CasA [Sphaerisporangium sp. NPDC049003]|uniref:type I-E CRISPR-associated protein Cse1/CasA n=1 Tax=Sphaerisporangium sp. NPDC049003 TaxID=3364517 RepID=UPI00371FE05B